MGVTDMELDPNRNRTTSPVFVLEDMKAAIINPEGKKVVINGVTEEEAEAIKEANEKEVSDAKANAGALLVVFFFIAGLIAAAVFSQLEPLYCISTIGAIFLVIGSAAVFQNKFSLEDLPMLIVPIVGLLMTGIPILMVYQRKHPGAMSFTIDNFTVIKLILVCMVILGLFLLIVPFVNHSKKMTNCTKSIDAMCIYRNYRIERSKKPNGMTYTYNVYAPTWQYEIDGVLYVTREDTFTAEDVPEIGETKQIRYNPNDYSEIYRPLVVKRLAPAVIGAMMIVMGIVTLVVMK